MDTQPPATTFRNHGLVTGPVLIRVLTATATDQGGSRHRLRGVDRVCLGRGTGTVKRSSGVLELEIADSAISSSHIEIAHADGGWILTDLGSTHGTRVNGEPCAERRLIDRDLIEVGNSFLVFRANVADPEARADDVFSISMGGPIGLRTLSGELAVAFAELERVARSPVPIWIAGPTGSGKELTAEAIHLLSGRSGELVAVNCAALPENLAESELFGYRKGAFSGATADRIGLVEASDGGTLFLDEVADLSPGTQARLLRVIETGEVRPVGAVEVRRLNLRVVSATHRDPERLVLDGAFREDLHGRLVGGQITLPPLRDRTVDLGLLLATIAESIPGPVSTTRDAARKLLEAAWPRNIRELRQVISTAAARADGERIDSTQLGPLEPARRFATPEDAARHAQLVSLLSEHRGNVSAVARAMNKDRRQIQRWMERYKLHGGDFAAR